jgi:hypothetical protein
MEPLRLLFAFRSRKTLEPFVGVVRRSLERGHTVRVVTPIGESKVSSLFDAHPQLSFASTGLQRGDGWRDGEPLLRSARDYLQYLKPPYHGARKLRKRAFEHLLERLMVTPGDLSPQSSEQALALPDEAIWRLDRLAALCEDAMPSDPLHDRVISQFEPDAVLISPLVHFGSAQVDVAKAARSQGVPVGMLLFSWDNLSTKGALHVRPDRLFVWNERQKREAVELHGMPLEDIRVTGAPRFDSFFALQPRIDRERFCAAAGLDPSRPMLLYLCSSKLVSEREAAFIRQWHTTVRASGDERLRDASIIVRPHPDLPVTDKKWLGPEEMVRWDGTEAPVLKCRRMFGHRSTVMLYSDADRPAVLYECIRHSLAVVGLNTSAEIEAGILGRPVLTVLADDESVDGQKSTLHYQYLLEEDGGFVRTAASLMEHERHLSEVVAHPPDPHAIQRRVGAFVRPVDWQRPAADVLVESIEREFEPVLRGSITKAKLAKGASGEVRPPSTPLRPGKPDTPSVADDPAIERRLPRGDEVSLVRINYNAVDIALATSSAEERAEVDRASRSPCIARWLDELTSPGDVVYIVPGNLGALALVAARALGATVYAFEGNIPRLARLWENIVLNGCEGSVVPLPFALGGDRGLQKQRCESASPVSPRDVPQRKEWRQHREVSSVVVQPCAVMTLDGAAKTWGLPQPKTIYIGIGVSVHGIASAGARTLGQVSACLVECASTEVDAAVGALAATGLRLRDHQSQPTTVALQFERRPGP